MTTGTYTIDQNSKVFDSNRPLDPLIRMQIPLGSGPLQIDP
jgi:hypothetical protein